MAVFFRREGQLMRPDFLTGVLQTVGTENELTNIGSRKKKKKKDLFGLEILTVHRVTPSFMDPVHH